MKTVLKLHVPDMTCSHCAASVTKAVKGVLPTAEVQVDLGAKLVSVTASDAPSSSLSGVSAALKAAGFSPTEA